MRTTGIIERTRRTRTTRLIRKEVADVAPAEETAVVAGVGVGAAGDARIRGSVLLCTIER